MKRSPFDRLLKYAKDNQLPVWAVIDRAPQSDYDGDVPRLVRDDDDPHAVLPVRDQGLTKEPADRRFRVITRPDGTRYIERHTGSLCGIQGRIQIFDTHKEAMEAMREA